ncbi:Hypothetical protein FKW44_005458 [Caligus rogercresseyi]|uniref:Uncharacterized protein n=1 Tax=Caligus rogercresseyi TaxID=217165 RepID=A0A7T8QS22_CALRO|nr:Hypothetical protein FKW44_005458 [Caligus rogercresseyi]
MACRPLQYFLDYRLRRKRHDDVRGIKFPGLTDDGGFNASTELWDFFQAFP